MSDDGILSDGQPTSPIGVRGRTPSELSAAVETTIDLQNGDHNDEWSPGALFPTAVVTPVFQQRGCAIRAIRTQGTPLKGIENQQRQ